MGGSLHRRLGDGEGEVVIEHHYEDQFKLALKTLAYTHFRKSELVRITKAFVDIRFEAKLGSKMKLTIGSVVMVGPADVGNGIFFAGRVQDLNAAGKGYWRARISYENVYMLAGEPGPGALFFRGVRLTGQEFPDFSDKANLVHMVKDEDPRNLSSEFRDSLMEMFFGFCDKYRKKS